jgi:hypothetical protein
MLQGKEENNLSVRLEGYRVVCRIAARLPVRENAQQYGLYIPGPSLHNQPSDTLLVRCSESGGQLKPTGGLFDVF